MSFRLVPKSVNLNDLERRNGRYFAFFSANSASFPAHCVKVHVGYQPISSPDEFLFFKKKRDVSARAISIYCVEVYSPL